MLQYRFRGSKPEADAFLAALEAAGCEVLRGGEKNRGEFWDTYGTIRHPDYQSPEGPVQAVVVQPRSVEGRRRRR